MSSVKNALALEALQHLHCVSSEMSDGGHKKLCAVFDAIEAAHGNATKSDFLCLISSSWNGLTKADLEKEGQKFGALVNSQRITKDREAEELYNQMSEADRVKFLVNVTRMMVLVPYNKNMFLYSTKYAVSTLNEQSQSEHVLTKFLAREALGLDAWSPTTREAVRDIFVKKCAQGRLNVTNPQYLDILRRICSKYDIAIAATPTKTEMVASLREDYSKACVELRMLIKSTESATDRGTALRSALQEIRFDVYLAAGLPTKRDAIEWIVEATLRPRTTLATKELRWLVALALENESHRAWFAQLENVYDAHGYLALLPPSVSSNVPPAATAVQSPGNHSSSSSSSFTTTSTATSKLLLFPSTVLTTLTATAPLSSSSPTTTAVSVSTPATKSFVFDSTASTAQSSESLSPLPSKAMTMTLTSKAPFVFTTTPTKPSFKFGAGASSLSADVSTTTTTTTAPQQLNFDTSALTSTVSLSSSMPSSIIAPPSATISQVCFKSS